ncbi:hypothetical protein A3709_05645 [Halioglobus sp. HI00S01]|uniref:DUF885 domain-containing protein n=1 Tax=Halioglobus sp. HI00S01 TaxID=1822214 RepID=UPI0007C391B9|nr:DUF885 domain-containing protein [Halioglobus sp. HI00S01]KZX56580.1 hypothetical protein A3709_05645 [Halioglobus sp. HI00S01]
MSRTVLGAALVALLGTAVLVTPVFSSEQPSQTSLSADQASESARANALFDDIFDRRIARDPKYQTYLGIKTDYDKWTPISEERYASELAHDKADLASLEGINADLLDDQTLLSYRLMEQDLQESISDYRWRHHTYPVNQMFGTHSEIPAFLINQHRIASVSDAQAYIARINGVKPLMQQLIEQLQIREQKGVIAPDFVLPHVISDSRNLLVGAPFEGGEPSTLMADFTAKVSALDISDNERHKLLRDAEMALVASFQPAYQDLIVYLENLQEKSTHEASVRKLPDGERFYKNRLARNTTTELNADEIHALGLAEVERIHAEMRVIKDKVGFEGTLQEFMQFMRSDDQFYLPNTDEGREEYLVHARFVLEDMEDRLDALFITKPKAELEVKRVEPFREKSAGKAFYQMPSADGSRPGKYYANLYDMAQMPTYQLEALAYHEGLPGHHMQIAIKQELGDLPKFRRFGGVTAYSEGWGLYSELLPKEIGLYQDPYSDFGRLAMELWRAVRLVVDTGMHAQGWSREASIEFYVSNTPNAKGDAVKMVERHAVMPGQATAYKIGMLKILEERSKAQQALANDFDIREFHEAVLRNGAVPLNVLEEQVDAYITRKRAIAASPEAKPAG